MRLVRHVRDLGLKGIGWEVHCSVTRFSLDVSENSFRYKKAAMPLCTARTGKPS